MSRQICDWCSEQAVVQTETTHAAACDAHIRNLPTDQNLLTINGAALGCTADHFIRDNVTEIKTPFDDPRPRVYGELCILRRLHVLYRVTRSINIKPDEAAAAAIEIEALEIALMEFVS